ncbi:hypothetical protein CAPTEDRAFT_190670 [Capitella teleta]|uniref:G-protein coupled receptors family 1 profile domain-containing protein n=1 Tax=Capitella teleta TaxID=283909 RepID=R7T6D2_CAPTE|nr:hypothetical protein CAPTEDRAFT_190670 [Capitella teleta]|eukprot:ELT88858.1 hypothetical protein CAPTEDRAFT_190670 [Capitella teleta]
MESTTISGFLQRLPTTTQHLERLNSTFRPDENDGQIASGLHEVLDDVIIPLLGVFGIVGNLLNLTILTFRYRKREVDVLEKGALLGLIALAVSDSFFCIWLLPSAAWPKSKTIFEKRNAELFFRMYGAYFSNVFIKTSTWLTMIIAMARYLGICYPLRARILIGLLSTKIAVVASFILWLLLCLPHLWSYAILDVDIEFENVNMTCVLNTGPFSQNIDFRLSMTYSWAVIGYFVPVAILTFCNICLIRALRQSEMLRARTARGQSTRSRDVHHKITVTLICLVAMFLLLVSPSEFLHFYLDVGAREHFASQELAVVITNLLQTINFACHFVLYVTVNVTFRRTLFKVARVVYQKIRGKREARPRNKKIDVFEMRCQEIFSIDMNGFREADMRRQKKDSRGLKEKVYWRNDGTQAIKSMPLIFNRRREKRRDRGGENTVFQNKSSAPYNAIRPTIHIVALNAKSDLQDLHQDTRCRYAECLVQLIFMTLSEILGYNC